MQFSRQLYAVCCCLLQVRLAYYSKTNVDRPTVSQITAAMIRGRRTYSLACAAGVTTGLVAALISYGI